MNKTFLTLCLVIAFAVNLQAQQAKRYAIKSGYLKLELNGSSKGTREIWWNNYGANTRELEKSTTIVKILGMKSTEETHQLTITSGNKFWKVDYVENSGITGSIPGNSGKEITDAMTEKEKEQFVKQFHTDMGGKITGSETLKSYPCDIMEVMGTQSWCYKGIVLKTQGKVMGIEINEMFSEFTPGTSVPDSRFAPPSDVEYRKIPSSTIYQ